MKQKIILSIAISILLCFSKTNFSQTLPVNTSGIYATATDFLQQKLTYEINCNSKDKLKLNEFFGSSTGYILYNGQRHTFDKTKVYGYRSCANKNYRFYNHSTYQILDTAGFYIYYQYRQEEITKGKEPVKKDEYFFSKNDDGDIQLLTIDNLTKAFPANDKFHYAIEQAFRSDKELMAYDNFRHAYKIKYFYNQSLK
jgi:hypothetical protein